MPIGTEADSTLGSSGVAHLTKRMRQGDEAAYLEFYRAYFDRLFRYLLVLTHGQEEEAREALQKTFLRVVRHIRQFDNETIFWSWLTALAKSAAIDEHRRQSRYSGLLGRFMRRAVLSSAPAPSGSEDSRLLQLLEANLAQLDEDERDLVRRKYFDKLGVAEIAASLGATEKAIESRLVRIRRKLKTSILAQLEQ